MRHNFKRSKYNAKRTEYNGAVYDSIREAAYARTLDILKRNGEVVQWIPQVPFRLPGKTRYVADFLVFYADGRAEFVDVKGVQTPTFKTKKKQVEEIYDPITIKVVK